MQEVFIDRFSSGNSGTCGLLRSEGFACKTLELPWRNNERKISRIPDGEYTCRVVLSPRFGAVYGIMDVPGRSHVLFHSGNYAGARPAYKSHVEGCILLGEKFGTLDGQLAVLISRPTVTRFMAHMKQQKFKLIISSREGV